MVAPFLRPKLETLQEERQHAAYLAAWDPDAFHAGMRSVTDEPKAKEI